MKKSFKFTLSIGEEKKILVQEIVDFGSEQNPVPENWQNDIATAVAINEFKDNMIARYIHVDVSEDLEFDK